jgi:hypothetical protein
MLNPACLSGLLIRMLLLISVLISVREEWVKHSVKNDERRQTAFPKKSTGS